MLVLWMKTRLALFLGCDGGGVWRLPITACFTVAEKPLGNPKCFCTCVEEELKL